MTKSGLPKSTRKFIRLEKARIRAQFFDIKKQEEMINELYGKFNKNNEAVKPSVDSETLNSKQIPSPKIKSKKTSAKVKQSK